MNRRSANWLTALVVFITAGLLLAPTSVLLAAPGVAKAPAPKFKIQVSHSTRNVTSPPAREYLKPAKPGATRTEIPLRRGPNATAQPKSFKPDPVAQRGGPNAMPLPDANFEGVGDVNFVQPPDTQGAVGPNHYVQWVNLSFQVFDKTGASLGGPFDGNSLWAPLGGICSTFNGGDPITIYDQLADRWFMSQLAYPTPYFQCMAVSVTNDPLGSYNLYEYKYSDTALNDYPKFGLWPDAYYMTAREFGGPLGFTMTVTAFDRQAMLNGQALTAVFVSLDNTSFDGLLPAYLDGIVTPPANAPEILMGIGGPDSDGSPTDVIHMYQFHPDFSNPPNSTFTGPVDLDVAAYTFVPQFSCAFQPDGGCLEANGWVQYRMPYRNFGDHESLVLEHDVYNASGIVTPRWYEVRDPYGTPTVYQQGTYDPGDGVYRWMGSIAMDANNNIAHGFSVTNSSTFPGIRYAGRLATDPLGDFTQGEATLIDGVGNFGGFRWGDYSAMQIDPVDDCTFWYTQEYIGQPGTSDWQTRIGSFKFPSCTTGPRGTLTGTVTDFGTGLPIAGASVQAGSSGTNTNSAGVYTMILPVGTYDVTASKYGYIPQTVTGVDITDGGTTTENFALNLAPTTVVSGTVTDGSGHGWPLYATIKITGSGYPGATLYTDPLTGSYSIALAQGTSYTFLATAVSPGYNTATATVPLHPSPLGGGFIQDFQLTVNASTCIAPGYSALISGLYESFDAGVLPPGWSAINNSGNGLGWRIVPPSAPCSELGNLTGGTGPYAIINSDCDFLVDDDAELRTPSVDMTSLSSAAVRFNLDYRAYYNSTADVDISTDGGTNWTNVFQKTTVDERGPALEDIDITGIAAGQSDVTARFHYTGYYAWWWQVDNVLLGQAACTPQSGGLVLGNVRDANTLVGLNGATITNTTSGGSTASFATPADPALDDGFYILFAPPGAQTLDASYPLYSDDIQTPTVVADSVITQDFSLATGFLTVSPGSLSLRLDPGTTGNLTLTLDNSGAGDASFNILELNIPLAAHPITRRFADKEKVREALARIPKDKLQATSTRGFPPLFDADDRPVQKSGRGPLTAGDVLNTYPTQLAYGWGVAYNIIANDFWISNLAIVGGDDQDYRYLTDGTLTGDTIDTSPWVTAFAADGTYNARTGMLWEVDVDYPGCIWEMDPVAKVSTGNSICPPFATSERGLAYDVTTDTYYSGSWNDAVINHFDGTGTILDSASVTLGNNCPVSSACIAGLAFNAVTGHLFVMTNDPGPTNVYVLDANNNYAELSSFAIPGFTAFGGAGFEADCLGHLWLVDQQTQTIYEVDSGESGWCVLDIPWLSENPTTGTVTGLSSFPVDVMFDATATTPGLHQAQLRFSTNTPTPVAPVGVDLTVRFLDVPDGSFAENFIYGLAGSGITAGCGGNNYCPNDSVTRAQMAVFIEKAANGTSYVPPACVPSGVFGDVLCPGGFAVDFIEALYYDGIAAGCAAGPPPLFCPNDNVTRAQMAVFIEKGANGPAFVPPPCTGIFADVPCPGGFAVDFIEALFNDGIAVGCGGGLYCPNDPVTRAQMAVFIDVAFNVPHL